MGRKPSRTELERRLRACARDYEALKARIHDIGFICTGSLVERWMQCGKPNCRCHADPGQRHGPYYQLSWKEGGVTVSRRLSPEHASLYAEWIANRRQLDSLVEQLHQVSAKAARHLLRAAIDEPAALEPPPQRSRVRKKR